MIEIESRHKCTTNVYRWLATSPTCLCWTSATSSPITTRPGWWRRSRGQTQTSPLSSSQTARTTRTRGWKRSEVSQIRNESFCDAIHAWHSYLMVWTSLRFFPRPSTLSRTLTATTVLRRPSPTSSSSASPTWASPPSSTCSGRQISTSKVRKLRCWTAAYILLCTFVFFV